MPKRRRPRSVADVPRAATSLPDAGLENAKRILAGASGALLVGLALSAVGNLTFGPYVTVLALGAGVFGAHKLGRAGRDQGIPPHDASDS